LMGRIDSNLYNIFLDTGDFEPRDRGTGLEEFFV
jgi:hypothetical protein